MKRFNILRLLLFALIAIAGKSAFAYDFESNGLYYDIWNVNSKSVKVTYRDGSFSRNNYCGRTVDIPNTVRYRGTVYTVVGINSRAFKGCDNLTEVYIGDNIESIDSEAFCGCKNLRYVEMGYAMRSIGYYAFCDCKRLEEVQFNKGLRRINDNAFKNCSSLYEIHLPNSLESIGEKAFGDCYELRIVDIPNSRTKVDNSAFDGCNIRRSHSEHYRHHDSSRDNYLAPPTRSAYRR